MNGIELECYEIWSRDGQTFYMNVWTTKREDAERIANLFDGIADFQCSGVVRPE